MSPVFPGIGRSSGIRTEIKEKKMNDNELLHKQYLIVATALVVSFLSIVLSITAYSIVDRIGPVRPIVTTSYQAK